jgi:hypothetical protein
LATLFFRMGLSAYSMAGTSVPHRGYGTGDSHNRCPSRARQAIPNCTVRDGAGFKLKPALVANLYKPPELKFVFLRCSIVVPLNQCVDMFERLLEPGSTAVPDCRCGSEMKLAKTEPRTSDTLIKFFVCKACSSEMRFMVWTDHLPTALAKPT